jgi:hypothetical protein
MSKDRCDVHHIVPSSVGGTNDDRNKEWVDMREHQHFHSFFSNRPPHEQIYKLLRWDSQVIQEPTLEELYEVTKQKIRDLLFYKKGVCKNPRF